MFVRERERERDRQWEKERKRNERMRERERERERGYWKGVVTESFFNTAWEIQIFDLSFKGEGRDLLLDVNERPWVQKCNLRRKVCSQH